MPVLGKSGLVGAYPIRSTIFLNQNPHRNVRSTVPLGPPTHYEVAFSVNIINLNAESLTIGDVVFREFTQELAQEWEFAKSSGLFREVLSEIVGLPVGIVTTQGRSARKAAERAQDSLERALNTLRACVGSFTRTKTWDRELLQKRGQARVMRETNPDPKLISTGGGPITEPIELLLTPRLVNSTNGSSVNWPLSMTARFRATSVTLCCAA